MVFDMDGLMLDTEPLYRSASRSAAAELGYDFSDALYASLIGRAAADVEAGIVAALGAAFPLAEFRAGWLRHWELLVDAGGIALKPGLPDLLDALAAAGIPAAVATSTHRERAHFSLRAAGLGGRFDVIVSGDQVTRGKPAPDIYLESAARLGVGPRDCVALEDSEAGIVAAAAAGMHALLVPDLALPSAAAIAAAREIFDTLEVAAPRVLALVRSRP